MQMEYYFQVNNARIPREGETVGPAVSRVTEEQFEEAAQLAAAYQDTGLDVELNRVVGTDNYILAVFLILPEALIPYLTPFEVIRKA